MNTDSHTLQQADIFQDFWERFSLQIKDGKGVSDFPTPEEQIPKHVTTVARIPDEVAQEIERVGAELLNKYPDHYLYPTNDLHFTFLNLDALFPTGFQKEHEIILKPLGDALHSLPPLTLEAKGLSLFPTTIFVQLYDTAGLVEQYRKTINDIIQSTLGFAPVENASVAKHVAFVNLLRFKSTPPPELVEDILPLREINFGSFTVPRLEFVTTDKLLSKQNTVIHSTHSLNF